MQTDTKQQAGQRYTFRCGQLISGGREMVDQLVSVVEGRIALVADRQMSGEGVQTIIDLDDAIITPGFIDVHTHGGGGFNLHTADAAEVQAYAKWAPSSGTTAFLAGTVGTPNTMPLAQLQAVVDAAEHQREDGTKGEPAAEIVGIHLEGPYINVERRGAHDPSWLRTPNEAETAEILRITRGYLRLVTVAPELPGGHEMVAQLAAAGVTVSIGHTDATYEQAREAIPLGITHATHCFNAMPSLLHRAPGALGAIVEERAVRGELIADGVHVHPALMKVLIGALGADRTVVVTDALSAAGIPDAVFSFGGQEARVIDGVARLADGRITGSVLTTAQALRNLVHMADVALPQAVTMLTINPARAAHVADRKGLILPDYDADLLIFDRELNLQATICRGRLAFVTPAWQARFAAMQSA